jgi:hypothetical protein
MASLRLPGYSRRDRFRSCRNFWRRGKYQNRQVTDFHWWACLDSNQEPDRYERPALTIELQAPPRGGRVECGRQRCRHRLQGRPRSGNAAVRSAARRIGRSVWVDPGARRANQQVVRNRRGAAARLAAHVPAGCQVADFPAVSDFQKLLLTLDPNQLHLSAVPSRKRGVAQRHETWGGMRWTRMVP